MQSAVNRRLDHKSNQAAGPEIGGRLDPNELMKYGNDCISTVKCPARAGETKTITPDLKAIAHYFILINHRSGGRPSGVAFSH
jgi:hypothetical protein